ncbi:ribose 5-phosphate isomerase B [Chitinispirillales bacterium ANBcel5]|uniref:ribose 5-phosphate isomerase B n=1 Tax=Cellulosispirillum alkaliphilum TaxID=3039283 RepID=UPI002A5278C4|nr:ribose 5-phosphate isomerase B [Chitinispirillales bacterium ANBcel5]
MNKDVIGVAGDHAGYEFKEQIKAYLEQKGFSVKDFGACQYDASDDYPVFASDMASAIAKGEYSRGVLFCGTGIGASIAANRHKGVRAALCFTPEMATLSRKHNNSNVVVLGARTLSVDSAKEILDAWLEGDFEGGRHQKRVELLDNLS